RHGRALGVRHAAGGAVVHGRHREAGDHQGQQHQHAGHDQVRQLHGLAICQPFRLRQHMAGLGGAGRRAAQDQIGAEQRRQRRAQRVERLHQVQPRGRGLRRAEHRHVGIGRYLQQRDAAGDDEQRAQRHAIRRQPRRRDHQQGAGGHHAQPDDHRFLVADTLDQARRRNRREEVGDEPHRLDQRRLRVVQVEHAAQVRQQGVVDDGDEAPREEQAGQQRQHGARAGDGDGRGGGRRGGGQGCGHGCLWKFC
ncbi:conserved hypothetical protein, partial [Ricinus communis]